jgi:pimeloyl-ACP methyl ester carboxylesterase
MDRNGIESGFLIGHQLGAMVALQVAATEPDMVAGLVLSGAVVAPSSMALGLQRMVIRLLPNKSLAESGATKADLLRALDLVATADFGKNLGRISAPALIIAGSGDPGRSAAQALAERLPSGRYAEIIGAGSDPSLEASAAYNELLLDFLSTSSAR